MSAVCALLLGCVGHATEPGPRAQAEGSAALLRQIQAQLGDAACDTDDQCRSVGVGAKACGGPEAYLPSSTLTAGPAGLASLVERYRQARQVENERSGVVSNCMVTPDPGAVCRARAPDGRRVCVLGMSQGGRPPAV